MYKAYQKDNFYGIRQFLESSFIESITDCCHTLDMTSLDKIITLSVCYVSAILGSKTVTQYYWKCSFQICLHGTSNNFRTRSFCIQQWKRPLSLNNLNWPHDLIIIEKITQSRATNYLAHLTVRDMDNQLRWFTIQWKSNLRPPIYSWLISPKYLWNDMTKSARHVIST